MTIYQVPIEADPLLRELQAKLADAAQRRPPVVCTVGNLRADVAGGCPSGDRDTPAAWFCGEMHAIHAWRPQPDVTVRSAIYYPPGGGLGWHTNSARPGWRAYVPLGDQGVMLTEDGPVLDKPGHANVFRVPGWHAVLARGARWVLGVILPMDHGLIAGAPQ